MGKDIYTQILNHFSDKMIKPESRKPLEIKNNYDLTVETAYDTIEEDCKLAEQAVRDLELNYTIDAKHYAKKENGVEEINSVDVIWRFWI